MAQEKVNIVVTLKDLASKSLSVIGNKFDKLRGKTKSTSTALTVVSNKLVKFSPKANVASRSVSKLTSGLNKLRAGLIVVGKGFDRLRAKSVLLAQKLEKAKFVFLGLSAAFGVIGFAALKTAGQFEQWNVAFSTMLGSAENGKALMKEIKDFAKTTPFLLEEVVQGSKSLLAYNIAQEQIIPTMKTLGNLAAGVGRDKFGRLVLAYGQVRAANKLYGTELRQFTETGIPLIDALAEHFGVATDQVRGMVEAGVVGFEDVKAALLSLTTGSGKFANLMEKQSLTFLGVLSNVQDAITLVALEFGNILLPSAIKVANIIKDLVDIFGALPPKTKKIIVGVALLTAAFTTMMAGLGIFVALAPFIGTAFGLAFGPIGIAIVAVGALTVGIAAVVVKTDDLKVSFAEMVNKFQDIGIAFLKLKIKMLDFFDPFLSKLNAVINKLPFLSKIKFGREGQDSLLEGYEHEIERLEEIQFLRLQDAHAAALDKEQELAFLAEENAAEAKLAEDRAKRAKQAAKIAADQKSVKASTITTAKQAAAQIFGIEKQLATADAIISTHKGIAKALGAFPPPLNFAWAAAVGAAGFAHVASIQGVKLASGGITTGPTNALIGDNASGVEAVVPLERAEDFGFGGGGGGLTVNINGPFFGDSNSAKEAVLVIDAELYKLRRAGESQAFD